MAASEDRTRRRNLRVLVLAPVGRDAPLICAELDRCGMEAEAVENVRGLCKGLRSGIGTAIIADEVLGPEALSQCVEALSTQPPWSDTPIIILMQHQQIPPDASAMDRVHPLGHVTILERPVKVSTLVSAARAALRSRSRQYDVRDHLEDLRQAEQEIRFANEQLASARDAAMEASRMKSAFLASVSHEVRTPLNAVLGYAEMIREDAETRKRVELAADVGRIIEAGGHLLTLINDILDLAKIEAGRMILMPESFDIAHVISTAAEMAAPLMRKNTNTLHVVCPDDIGAMVADEAKVRQCLLNLLSNAAKFTEKGEVELAVRRETETEGPGSVVFRVRDSGIGMRAEDISRLFTAFVQVDSSWTRRYAGTGLGLALTRRFAQMMGGSLDVQSEPGSGSTFIMRLPATVKTPKPADERPAKNKDAREESGTAESISAPSPIVGE